VNDVYIDPRNAGHVLLATDRSGVLSSTDAGARFAAANAGFSERKVEALLVDRENPSRLYAGVVNDKEYGGAFVSNNSGASWDHIGNGLNGLDVYALAQAQDGTVVAGTSQGIFALESGANAAGGDDPPAWQPRNTIANTIVKAAVESLHGKRIDIEKTFKEKPRQLDGRVNALDLSGDGWVAAGADGLFTSRDKGATWQGGPVMGADDYLSVTAHGKTFAAARPDGVVISEDAGLTWMPMHIPLMLTRIHRIAFSADGSLWLGAREGVFFTNDLGKTWQWIQRLPFRDVDDLCYDNQSGRVLVSSRTSDQIFAIDPKTLGWKWWQTGYDIALIRISGQRLVAASLYDGVLVEPHAAGAETSQR
jgi:ligand-binding sensor domain-containing protein